jgi:hypothetical protein
MDRNDQDGDPPLQQGAATYGVPAHPAQEVPGHERFPHAPYGMDGSTDHTDILTHVANSREDRSRRMGCHDSPHRDLVDHTESDRRVDDLAHYQALTPSQLRQHSTTRRLTRRRYLPRGGLPPPIAQPGLGTTLGPHAIHPDGETARHRTQHTASEMPANRDASRPLYLVTAGRMQWVTIQS